MDIRREVVDVLSKSIDAEKNEAFFQVKLQELGISSIDFFKIMISLSKLLEYDYKTLILQKLLQI